MKRALDGTFTQVAYDGEVITKEVPLDFLPGHKIFDQGRSRGAGNNEYNRWSVAEDEALISLRAQGMVFERISEILQRPVDGVKRRYRNITRRRSR